MREPLTTYKSHNRVNYLCIVAAEMLGEMSLARLPALLAGFESVWATLPAEVTQALHNIRLAGLAPGTHRELVLMADAYRSHHRRLDARRGRGEADPDQIQQRYVINEDLSIRRLWTHLVPEDVTAALHALTTVLPVQHRTPMPLHEPTASAEVASERGYSGLIAPLKFIPPDPPLYDASRIGRAPGLVPWSALIAMAKQFDTLDVASGRQTEGSCNWFWRLHDLHGVPTAVLLKGAPTGLTPADGIDLKGIKHLIGLPGSGKTTLLYLLAAHLAKQGHSVCFLFPSIEVATGFIETLSRYGVMVGLLSGQGETSRTKHVLNFATALSAQNHGFGVTRHVAPFFATNCALAGFASDEENDFPHNNPPCRSVMQREKPHKPSKKRRCALASVCGLQYGERTLIDAKVWAGHVLSMDRNVSQVFSDVNIRHFEYLARTFDVLVIDECDGSQTNLDMRGTPIMKLSGDSESLWSALIRDIHQPAAGGRNAFVAGETLPALLEMTGRFGRATERLVARIMHAPKKFRADNANLLMTSLSIIADMFEDESNDEEESQRHYAARQALERIWDTAVKLVAFRHAVLADPDEEETDLDRAIGESAILAQADESEVRDFYERLLVAIELWERDGNETAVHAIATALRTAPNLVSTLDDEAFFNYSALLVTVSLLVLQHFGLAPHLRLMNAEGLVSDDVFESRPSRDQLAILPESLVGRLSGVRYTVSEEGDINVTHVGFASTPRLLPNRMARLGKEAAGSGMAVLMTSATSMLEQSPSYHVSIGPDYVLQRPNAGSGWVDSRYSFIPKTDPLNATVPLRFSGAKMSQRDRILKSMVDQLLRGGMLSDVETAIRENDVVNGMARKAAFIVNSYEQCEMIFAHIQASHPAWRGRVRYLVRATLHGGVDEYSVTAAEVEQLGSNRGWDLLIFPMSAIGRGVNIVYQFGARINKAMIGSLFFLTRPHPRGDSLQLIQGLVGQASERFDRRVFSTTAEALDAMRKARHDIVHTAEYLLRMPLVAQALGKYAEPFVADQMIIILQTIGRAMRGDCPAFVYFVDAAWAPNSARGGVDVERTSMLVMMQSILKRCLNHPEPSKRECYHHLYQSFAIPLNDIANLNTPESTTP